MDNLNRMPKMISLKKTFPGKVKTNTLYRYDKIFNEMVSVA